MKSWIRKVVHEEDEKEVLDNETNRKPTLAEEAAAAAKAAAAAASDVARASQEMLASKTEGNLHFFILVFFILTLMFPFRVVNYLL